MIDDAARLRSSEKYMQVPLINTFDCRRERVGIDKSYNNNNHFIYFIDTHVTPSPPSMRAGTDLATATTLAATSQGNKQASNSSSGSSGSGSEKRCLACKRLIVFAYRLGCNYPTSVPAVHSNLSYESAM
ncbi:unnamed protein product [Ceratitis capitata]|uniref:(Mediterranean fruit fly) hypothetical protein n=1 Tax=Ceratitis capitata TaxID=7213 RepID=A0A811U7X3_CERCA|nr:unnamed protein product [Ceratitis capitata]